MALPAVLTQFSHAESAEISRLERERLPLVAEQMPLNRYMPLGTADSDQVIWEFREDVTGMVFAVGTGEPLPSGDNTDVLRFGVEPGEFGESRRIRPEQITGAREMGTFGEPLNVDRELATLQQEIAVKEQTLIEFIRAQMLIFGRAVVAKRDGTTAEIARWNVNSTTVGTFWTDLTNSTPLADLETLVVNSQGQGHDFTQGEMMMSLRTRNFLMRNRNVNDLFGLRAPGLSTYNDPTALAEMLSNRGLPTAVINDSTYKDASGAVQRFIPDGYILVVGARPDTGVVVGDYLMVRHPSNPGGSAGLYTNTWVPKQHPKVPHTERGHRGGPRIRYRRQVQILRVY